MPLGRLPAAGRAVPAPFFFSGLDGTESPLWTPNGPKLKDENPTSPDSDGCSPDRRGSSPPSLVSGSAGSNERDICRICHCEGDGETPLVSPCCCTGSLRYVHQACLQQWINSSDTRCCELCKFEFIMHTRIKPFRKWEKLEMSPVERRKMVCSITFHVVAITCVVWSLYVLIDRTAEELRSGIFEWPFWTKLVVVAIGFTGGLVFMYVQCKMYVQLFRRWRAYNRIIYVQNVPKKPTEVPPPLVDPEGGQTRPQAPSEPCGQGASEEPRPTAVATSSHGAFTRTEPGAR